MSNIRKVKASTNRIIFILCFTFLVTFPTGVFGQNPSPSDYSKLIDSLSGTIQEGMKNENIPGLSIAIVTDDKNFWSKGFGFTDISTQQPVTSSTLFSLQSISKTYT